MFRPKSLCQLLTRWSTVISRYQQLCAHQVKLSYRYRHNYEPLQHHLFQCIYTYVSHADVPSIMRPCAPPCLSKITSLLHLAIQQPLYRIQSVALAPMYAVKPAGLILTLLLAYQSLPVLVLLGVVPCLKWSWSVLLPVPACAKRVPAPTPPKR